MCVCCVSGVCVVSKRLEQKGSEPQRRRISESLEMTLFYSLIYVLYYV